MGRLLGSDPLVLVRVAAVGRLGAWGDLHAKEHVGRSTIPRVSTAKSYLTWESLRHSNALCALTYTKTPLQCSSGMASTLLFSPDPSSQASWPPLH
jgi:hypothetical protein